MSKATTSLLAVLIAFAQANAQMPAQAIDAKYLEKINKQVSTLDRQLTSQTTHYLSQVASEESALQKKLTKLDTAASKNLLGNTAATYGAMQNSLLHPAGNLPANPASNIPSLDTLKNTLLFLQQHKDLLSVNPDLSSQQLTATIRNIQSLQDKIAVADNLKDQLNQRKQYLAQQLAKYGLAKDLSAMNKKVYYYKQQLLDWKETIKSQNRLQQKATIALSHIPAYKSFIQQHSYLASIFGTPENYDLSDSSAMQGLQTRATVQQMIQEKVASGGPGAGQQIAQQVQQAGVAMDALKSKLDALRGNPDAEDLGFKPNTQKTKSLWQRLEYGANLQFESSKNILPAICNIGLSLGYKLGDNATIGAGAAFKLGLGTGIQNIHFSGEGLSLRSYLDWRLKKSLYITGGYERNYFSTFTSLQQLREQSGWQHSGLIGLSQQYKISQKVKGKIQLLFDFLSYNQIPRPNPILFRTGWSF